MSFFQKDETQKNLQYDDIAFLHFILTMSLTSIVVFGFLVFRRLKSANIKNIKNYKKLKQSGLFAKQIEHEASRLKKQKITRDFYIMAAVLTFSVLLSVGLAVFISSHTTQMIGFDPHQILGVAPEATVNQIKKAYRKLALQFHPDRNPNNPQAHAKFIMISKSYECLTDESKKQNCLKFGNPDGQASFQVGIGLPKFIISKQNQFVILPIVFFILLFIVPTLILKWSNGLKSKDNFGLDIDNSPLLQPFYRPEFNASFGFYLLTVLKQLKTDKKLGEQQKAEFLKFLGERKIVDLHYVNKTMTEGQIYTLHRIFKHMALRQPDADLCKEVPELLNSLMNFSLIFAKRGNDKKPILLNAPPIDFLGTQHMFMLLQFIRTFYNCCLFNVSILTPFDHLDLTPQDRKVSQQHPLTNLRQILSNQDKRKQHLSFFTQHHREYIEKQLKDLPLLKIDIKVTLNKQQVHEFTVEDFPQIYFKITKQNSTSGYCFINKFPYLKEEKYYFYLIYGNNLIHFEEVTFEDGKSQFVGKLPYRQSVVRDMKFYAFLASDCRYGLDVQRELNFKVVEPKPEEAESSVQIHSEDVNLQKQPKSYFQKMLSLQIQNPSDNELSDTEDQSPQENKKPKSRMEEEKPRMRQEPRQGCCDHEH